MPRISYVDPASVTEPDLLEILEIARVEVCLDLRAKQYVPTFRTSFAHSRRLEGSDQ